MCTEPVIIVNTLAGATVAQSAAPSELIPALNSLFASADPQKVPRGDLESQLKSIYPDPRASFITCAHELESYIFNAVVTSHELLLTHFWFAGSGYKGIRLGVLIYKFNWTDFYEALCESGRFHKDTFGFLHLRYADLLELNVLSQELIDLIFNRVNMAPDNRVVDRDECIQIVTNMGDETWLSCKAEGDRLYLNVKKCLMCAPRKIDASKYLVEFWMKKRELIFWTKAIGQASHPACVQYKIPDYSKPKLKSIREIAKAHPGYITINEDRMLDQDGRCYFRELDAVDFLRLIDPFLHMSSVQVILPEVNTPERLVALEATCINSRITGSDFPKLIFHPHWPVPAFEGSALEFLERLCGMPPS